MEQIQEFFAGPIGAPILSFLGGVLLLIVGYLVARLVASLIRRLLKRTNLDNQAAKWFEGEDGVRPFSVEDVIGKIVFWLIFLFFIVGFLQQINLPGVAVPLQSLLDRITTEYLPRLGSAALLLVAAFVIATVLRSLVRRGAAMLNVDNWLSKHASLEEGEQVSVAESLATAVYWFIFLLFLPAILNALGVQAIAAPIQNVFEEFLSYIPNIFGAAITLLIGWFIARVVRQVVSNLLAALGSDSFGERLGLTGERTLSKMVGTVLYTFILLFAIISALDSLNIEAISQPATLMLTTLIDALPNIFGAALVLVISFYIGRMIANLITDLLRGVGFDNIPSKLGLTWSGTRRPTHLVSYLIIVGIMLFASLSAAELLGSDFLSGILATFIGFGGQLVLAVIIFAIGLYLANLARNLILSAGGTQANFTATLARVAILVLTTAMALRQLGVANDIVNMAFGIMLGALGVAAALAFGLGSREIAGREVERLVANLRGEESSSGD
ncbi:mechanosensitive ion channel [Candidatus Leptofilum sp.]|uniref:mechanosensitive ion channel n=1 Tax=Candidatus Leptofilum sp. TaxID=3241576 RepID=UPI003B5A3063